MGELRQHPPALLLVAVITRYEAALAWARERLHRRLRPIRAREPDLSVRRDELLRTDDGPGLGTTFLTFQQQYDPGETAATKLATNAWEAEYAALGRHPESRPLNLDPGYLTSAKLVLSSTKDHTHRLYLGQGIFGEVTLFYRHGAWRDHEFTFPELSPRRLPRILLRLPILAAEAEPNRTEFSPIRVAPNDVIPENSPGSHEASRWGESRFEECFV